MGERIGQDGGVFAVRRDGGSSKLLRRPRRVALSLLPNGGLLFERKATMQQTMPGSVRQSTTRHPDEPQSLERCPVRL